LPLPRQTTYDELVKTLRALGWSGPVAGSKHPFMIRGKRKLRLPDPHGKDIGIALLSRILQQAGITTEDWLRVQQP
jgi:hypothetical protein